MRKVICVETGVVYESIKAASYSQGGCASMVGQAIKSGGWGGEYHWKYYDGEEKGITLKELEEEREREFQEFWSNPENVKKFF